MCRIIIEIEGLRFAERTSMKGRNKKRPKAGNLNKELSVRLEGSLCLCQRISNIRHMLQDVHCRHAIDRVGIEWQGVSHQIELVKHAAFGFKKALEILYVHSVDV